MLEQTQASKPQRMNFGSVLSPRRPRNEAATIVRRPKPPTPPNCEMPVQHIYDISTACRRRVKERYSHTAHLHRMRNAGLEYMMTDAHLSEDARYNLRLRRLGAFKASNRTMDLAEMAANGGIQWKTCQAGNRGDLFPTAATAHESDAKDTRDSLQGHSAGITASAFNSRPNTRDAGGEGSSVIRGHEEFEDTATFRPPIMPVFVASTPRRMPSWMSTRSQTSLTPGTPSKMLATTTTTASCDLATAKSAQPKRPSLLNDAEVQRKARLQALQDHKERAVNMRKPISRWLTRLTDDQYLRIEDDFLRATNGRRVFAASDIPTGQSVMIGGQPITIERFRSMDKEGVGRIAMLDFLCACYPFVNTAAIMGLMERFCSAFNRDLPLSARYPPEVIQDIEDIFRFFDSDGSGSVSVEEVLEAMPSDAITQADIESCLPPGIENVGIDEFAFLMRFSFPPYSLGREKKQVPPC
jgi:hypothetical protein